MFHRILFAVLDYYLDFSIITPTQITNYNQTGFFGKSTRSLDLAKIKSVRVDQQGIMRSLWNYGSIVFLSE
ncbi:MAG: hypothetical protein H6765_01510 [Candidatus Peribacteria bacterium]|nr:MAG: hypothetical protein H6765_01510 [Candidatus Peribacteria bacterium]